MRVPHDIDDGDRRQRSRLARNLIRSRQRLGLTQDDLGSRLGVTGAAVRSMEHRLTWEARTVQAWARALDRELHLELVGITVPTDCDIPTLTYELALEAPLTDPADIDLLRLRLTHRRLLRSRWAAGITDVQMGQRLGIGDNAVRHFDQHPDGTTLIGLQRYARALDGRLRPCLNRRQYQPQHEYLTSPDVTARLAAANTASAARAAARDAEHARALLAADPDAETLTGRRRQFVTARAEHPTDSLTQLAQRCGVAKDVYAAVLRRALQPARGSPDRTTS